MPTRTEGAIAEDVALEFLLGEGLQVLSRNFRRPFGELDLVMTDGPTLVFVEVRLRQNTRYGAGFATVTRQKQRRLIRTANAWLTSHRRLRARPCRFDVVSLQDGGSAASCTWIKNAFSADEGC